MVAVAMLCGGPQFWRQTVKTYSMKLAEIDKEWLIVDATDVPLGRLATQVSSILRGKHKPTYTPHLDMGDNVIVINAANVELTGQKSEKKTYQRYSGYSKGRKVIPIQRMIVKHPEHVVTHAVWGMMPKGKLGRKLMTNLRVYMGGDHPHSAQKPRAYELPKIK
jgi:large subunit ribosomal protein L13